MRLKTFCMPALLLGGVLACGGAVEAQNAADYFGPLLRMSDTGLANQGFAKVATFGGKLKQGTGAKQTLTFEPGQAQVIAMCDANCSTMDMYVVDAEGHTVGQDLKTSTPLVKLASGGTYTLKLAMTGCKDECVFVVRTYHK